MQQISQAPSINGPLYDGGSGIVAVNISSNTNEISDANPYFLVQATETIDSRYGDRTSCQLANVGRWSSRGCLTSLDNYTLDMAYSHAYYNGREVAFTEQPSPYTSQTGHIYILSLYETPTQGKTNSYSIELVWRRKNITLPPPTPTPQPGPETYCLEIKAPVEAVDFFNREQAYIINKLEFAAHSVGWNIPAIEITPTGIKIYFQEIGSEPITITILVLVGIIVAILAVWTGTLAFTWKAVKMSEQKTIQEGIQSKDNALSILKQVRDSIAANGGDTSAIDDAIARLSVQEPNPGGNSNQLLIYALVAVVAFMAIKDR